MHVRYCGLQVHVGKYLYVDTVGSKAYRITKCHRVDYSQGGRGTMRVLGSCKHKGEGEAYENQGLLHSSLCGCKPGACRHGCTPVGEELGSDEGSEAWLEEAEEGIAEWLQGAESTVIKAANDISSAAGNDGGAGIAAGVLAFIIMVAGIGVLYRR